MSHEKDYRDEIVLKDDGGFTTYIFQRHGNSITTIPVEKLEWHSTDGENGEPVGIEYLTLREIGEQVQNLIETDYRVVFVWFEGPLYGYIYQTGNYSDDNSWILYGETQGYA